MWWPACEDHHHNLVLQTPEQQIPSAREEQLQREERAEHRARDAALSAQRRIKEIGKESALTYGQLLYKVTQQALAAHIARDLEAFVLDKTKARRFASAMPFLDNFKGPNHIAAVALTCAVDNLSRRTNFPTFCQQIGKAIERELRLMELERQCPAEMRHLMKTGMSRSKLASWPVMADLGVYKQTWKSRTRLDVGAMLADAVIQSTELFVVKMQACGRGRRRIVCPSQQAEHFIAAAKAPMYRVSHSAMLCQPEPWSRLWGGGHIGNQESLIRVPVADIDLAIARKHYEETDLSWLYRIINHLQQTQLEVTPEIVSVARIAWEGGFPGLWPCARAPMEPPPRLGHDPDKAELKARNRLAAIAHRDREQNRPNRIRIERTLQLAEELSGRQVWQSFHCDHRGRIYSGNRYVTHQGPDHEKAMLDFKQKLPVDTDGMAWILKAAAGHHSLGRASWEERATWGWDNRQLMLAVAEDPLGKIELWRGASDPWQFLQLCRGYAEALETGRTGVPIRLDQTTSGCGILSALVRDGGVARLCNLTGDTRKDLYEMVAERVLVRLQKDLDYGDVRQKTLAEIWLKRGITRKLVKGPVLSVPYGGSYQGVADTLLDDLDRHLGHVPLDEFKLRVSIPSKYMASHLWEELKDAVQPCNAVKSWLKQCCRKLMSHGHKLHWHGPSGWPFVVADREPKNQKVTSYLYGKKIHMNVQEMRGEAPLCPTLANKSLPANFTHGFDAAMVHQFLLRAEEQCVEVLTNHDCFACHPTNASWMHETLLETFHDLYQQNHLEEWRQRLQFQTGMKLPKPPLVSTLDPNEIGTNPYLFS